MTEFLISDSRGRVGRKKQWAQDMQARFAEGTFERIAAVLVDGEDRTDFVRTAVDAELKRRERRPKLKGQAKIGENGTEG
ncbi:MAG TPA: hypothetical protein VL356_02530 [Acidocella sp.]|nr:hypothetical protein [Acidocella sp.]